MPVLVESGHLVVQVDEWKGSELVSGRLLVVGR